MHFRLLTLADKEAYQQLVHKAYRPTLALGIHFAAADADLTLIETHLQTNSVYGLFIDGQLVCSAALRLPWGNNPGPFGVPHLGWVATDPDYKQQGLAVKMLHWLENDVLLAQFKAPFVTLGTAENHPWLGKFYRSLGFEAIGTTRLSDDHITVYYCKVLDQQLFRLWQQYNPNNTILSKFK